MGQILVFQRMGYGSLKFPEVEAFPQGVHHQRDHIIFDVHLGQVREESSFLIFVSRDDFRDIHGIADGVDMEVVVFVHDTTAKDKGRDVSLSGGPKAQYDPFLILLQTALIGIFHDGWIEKGRGLDGEFLGEISADDVSNLFGQRLALDRQRVKQMFNTFEVLFKDSGKVAMTTGKLPEHVVEYQHLFLSRQGKHPLDDGASSVLITGQEETGDDPPVVGVKLNGFSLEGHRHGASLLTGVRLRKMREEVI